MQCIISRDTVSSRDRVQKVNIGGYDKRKKTIFQQFYKQKNSNETNLSFQNILYPKVDG